RVADRRIADRIVGQYRCLVGVGDLDGEGLRCGNVDATVGGTAVVHDVQGDDGRAGADRHDRRREAERAGGRNTGPGSEDAGRRIAVDDEAQALPGFGGRTGGKPRGPGIDGQRTGVVEHVLVGTDCEAGCIVDLVDGDVEGLRRRSVDAAIG